MIPFLKRVAVTGAGGRLGTALVAELTQRHGSTVLPWRQPAYDLDSADPARLLDRDRPSLVIHAAAWTDVDGCARDPALAKRRNTDAVASLSGACAALGVPLILISTNEVFDGERNDGLGYTETDLPHPLNPYGASKLAGEIAARSAFGGARPGLWIARTAWLYGPPGNDFPTKILGASDRLPADEPLPVVADETGSPTYSRDLARAVVDLVHCVDGGLFNLVNTGTATRYEWAEAILARCRPNRRLRRISRSHFERASVPPAWSVLDGAKAAGLGVHLCGWRDALADYLDSVC